MELKQNIFKLHRCPLCHSIGSLKDVQLKEHVVFCIECDYRVMFSDFMLHVMLGRIIPILEEQNADSK